MIHTIIKSKLHIFLGGTCNDSKWRDIFIKMLPSNISYFNPVVPDWTEECYIKELEERENADIVLYTITPKMTGVYSIAEVIDDSNKKPESTILCILRQDPNGREKTIEFDESQWKSLNKVAEMVKRNGGNSFTSLEEVIDYIKTL